MRPLRACFTLCLAGAVVVTAGAACLAPLALANGGGPPRWEPYGLVVHSTRVIIGLELKTEELETNYQVEYAPAEADGKAPPSNSSTWKLTNHGGFSSSTTRIYIGELDPGESPGSPEQLRGLKPNTSYYARFAAENAGSKGEEIVDEVPFKTLAVGKPEIPRTGSLEGTVQFEGSSLMFTGVASSGASARFHAKIETNGAQTAYSFEYAPAGAGGACPVETSGSWQPFTNGGTGVISGEYEKVEANITGLIPETTYCVRLRAANENGELVQTKYYDETSSGEVDSFTTRTGKPEANLEVRNVTGVSAHLKALVVPHGSETVWRLEYATSESGPWSPVPGGAGIISLAEAQATPYVDNAPLGSFGHGVTLAGLSPSTTYYVRLFAETRCVSHCGSVTSRSETFVTSGPPSASTFMVHALHGEALRLLGSVNPNSSPTSAEQLVTLEGHPTGGTFTLTFKGQTTGASGTATTVKGSDVLTVTLSAGERTMPGEAISGPGIPAGATIVEENISEENNKGTIVLSAAATESAVGVTVRADLPYNAPAETVRDALEVLRVEHDSEPNVVVEGPAGGPYTIGFDGHDVGVSEPLIEGSGLGLVPLGGSVQVTSTLVGGVAYVASAHFEYVSQEQFEASGWSSAVSTSEQSIGSGDSSVAIGQDLPALTAGEGYRYRISATSTLPGNPVVDGSEQSLTVPVPPSPVVEEACPNQAFRIGISAHLPDCRAYEQLTPIEKGGAMEPFRYEQFNISASVLVGEGGESVALEDPLVKFGGSAGSGQSPYFFTRDGGPQGWLMTAGSPQPETAGDTIDPQAYSANLGEVALRSEQATTPFNSPEAEYKVGPAGGPYVTVASVPHQYNQATSWVAANGAFSTLVLATSDHVPLDGSSGKSTGTTSGTDLYEYAGGQLRRLNVDSEGHTIGTCGANVVEGKEEGAQIDSSPHTVSADGSKVFFEAVPTGEACSEPANLYMRVDGEKTVDIGAYKFVAADSEGEKVLLEKPSGTNPGLYLYLTGSETANFLPSSSVALAGKESGVDALATLKISRDLSTIYIYRGESLYRYDVGAQTLQFLFEASAGHFSVSVNVSPDGRYVYVNAGGVAGLPPSGVNDYEVFRYDSVENVVECVSCASPYDPEPKQPSFLYGNDGSPSFASAPVDSNFSAGGGFVFFTTPAALVREDDDGERPIEDTANSEFPDIGGTTSPSSDVYEWRRDGLYGCVKPQGCLALITDGQGGYMNLLLGSADEGRDVFVYTRSKLLAQDNDTSGDIYDARIGGGFPGPPPRPVECTGGACSSPPSAPNDSTPSSLRFSGNGNVTQPVTPASGTARKKKVVKKATKRKKKPRKKTRAKRADSVRGVGR
jgi:hypothetical protein